MRRSLWILLLRTTIRCLRFCLLPTHYQTPSSRDCGYPFKHLSGVGIAFKLCQALEQREPGRLPKWQELTELAALGTVADIVPLIGETASWCAVAEGYGNNEAGWPACFD